VGNGNRSLKLYRKHFNQPSFVSRRYKTNKVVVEVRCIVLGAALVFFAGCDDSGSAPDIVQTTTAVTAPTPPASAPTPPPTTTPATTNCAPESGSFLLTASGFTNDTAATALYKYYPCDKLAQIFLPALSGPSNATSFTASPLPDFLIPASLPFQEHPVNGYDNDVEQSPMSVYIQSGSNVITYSIRGNEAGWTASGSKGVGLQVITVFLD
jgi:hypothetical protein